MLFLCACQNTARVSPDKPTQPVVSPTPSTHTSPTISTYSVTPTDVCFEDMVSIEGPNDERSKVKIFLEEERNTPPSEKTVPLQGNFIQIAEIALKEGESLNYTFAFNEVLTSIDGSKTLAINKDKKYFVVLLYETADPFLLKSIGSISYKSCSI
jgi:hypothetical protein